MTIHDPWAPIDSALARLEHQQQVKAARERERAHTDALRAEWRSLTETERLEIWDGEHYTPFEDLPEFAHYGREAVA